ncbi:hypothetical protein GGR56DRAFT_678228 [Xylariaceae sp. FL0804]|nr:hypothetical protein GGR56DRAFT_678228 [Xylariaceae sp. FL0804]
MEESVFPDSPRSVLATSTVEVFTDHHLGAGAWATNTVWAPCSLAAIPRSMPAVRAAFRVTILALVAVVFIVTLFVEQPGCALHRLHEQV